jgi:hypothetical protein
MIPPVVLTDSEGDDITLNSSCDGHHGSSGWTSRPSRHQTGQAPVGRAPPLLPSTAAQLSLWMAKRTVTQLSTSGTLVARPSPMAGQVPWSPPRGTPTPR